MRKINVLDFVNNKNKLKKLYTAGPASLLVENIIGLRPCFGRGDKDYISIENFVIKKLKKMSGHKFIARMQGSGSLALEIVASNFFYGKILIVDTGYYSDRLKLLVSDSKRNFKNIKKVESVSWKKLDKVKKKFDWIWACPTETSIGFKIPIEVLKKLSKRINLRITQIGTTTNIYNQRKMISHKGDVSDPPTPPYNEGDVSLLS